MTSKISARLTLCIALAFAIVIGMSEVAYQIVPIIGMLYEGISIDLDCATGALDIKCLVSSYISTLVHYPSEVDMLDSHLLKCMSSVVIFNGTGSSLIYTFNDTSPEDARAYADALAPSMNSAFGLTFDWQYTSSTPFVVVCYCGPGIPDMVLFTDNLRSKCLKSDIGGFSNVFVSMVAKSPQSTVHLEAHKSSGSFQWMYNFEAEYMADMPPSEDSHTVDVLDLLGVSELAPSPYCAVEGVYESVLSVTIDSPWNVTYISCQPFEAITPGKGWYIFEGWYSFDFYNDPSPVGSLSITFGGKVVPEFTSFVMMLMFLGATAWIPIFKKRFSTNRGARSPKRILK